MKGVPEYGQQPRDECRTGQLVLVCTRHSRVQYGVEAECDRVGASLPGGHDWRRFHSLNGASRSTKRVRTSLDSKGQVLVEASL